MKIVEILKNYSSTTTTSISNKDSGLPSNNKSGPQEVKDDAEEQGDILQKESDPQDETTTGEDSPQDLFPAVFNYL